MQLLNPYHSYSYLLCKFIAYYRHHSPHPRELSVHGNRVPTLRPLLSCAATLEVLRAPRNDLSEIECLSGTCFPQLVEIDVSENHVTKLPRLAGEGEGMVLGA